MLRDLDRGRLTAPAAAQLLRLERRQVAKAPELQNKATPLKPPIAPNPRRESRPQPRNHRFLVNGGTSGLGKGQCQYINDTDDCDHNCKAETACQCLMPLPDDGAGHRQNSIAGSRNRFRNIFASLVGRPLRLSRPIRGSGHRRIMPQGRAKGCYWRDKLRLVPKRLASYSILRRQTAPRIAGLSFAQPGAAW